MHFSKRIFIISSALLAILLIFGGIYGLVFKSPKSNQGSIEKSDVMEEENTKTEKNSPENTGKIKSVSDTAVLFPVLNNDEQTIDYFDRDSGKIYQVDFDGVNKSIIFDKDLPETLSLAWSPDKAKAIIEMPGRKFSLLDFENNQQTPLKDNLDTVIWQSNAKILYKYFSAANNERTLNIADPDGKNWHAISPLEYKKVSFALIPRTGLVSYWNTPDAFTETRFETIPAIGGEGKTLFSGKFGADYLWSPDGSRLLISHSDQKGGERMQLAITNDKGGEYKNLEIPTFVSKCVWSANGKIVYYALPGDIPENSILPNDYLDGKFKTKDTFWKLDVTTGKQERVIELNELNKINTVFDATNLFLSQDESMLFFTNRIDGKLYRIDL